MQVHAAVGRGDESGSGVQGRQRAFQELRLGFRDCVTFVEPTQEDAGIDCMRTKGLKEVPRFARIFRVHTCQGARGMQMIKMQVFMYMHARG